MNQTRILQRTRQMSTSTISPATARRATLDDLARVDGKAELIAAKIVHEMATGYEPNRVAFRIARSLDDHAEMTGYGVAFTDNMGFAIPELPSGRESFSPNASFDIGPPPSNPMRFIQGAPTFAVEVRSDSDYGPAAEKLMAAKRGDYFLAGTLVVWDVDLIGRCVRKYRADSPDQPGVFIQGEQADAEPAVPGWRLPVDRVFS
jgi:Uma2 family endonuclease